MAIKLVEAGEPSIVHVDRDFPAMPRSEAQRIHRASRAYADVLLPTAMKGLAEALVCEDWDVRWKAIDRVLKLSLNGVSNETVDPDEVVVDSTAKESEALKALEKETEKGTGLPDE